MRVTSSPNVGATRSAEAATQVQKACIDRFEKTESGQVLAVLLVGQQEKVMDVPRNLLPAGAKEGDWLQVEIKGDKLVSAKADPKETEARRKEIQDLFESVSTVSTKACIDRFEKCEDGRTLAVVLVGDEEKSIDVPVEKLPAGAKEGDWLQVEMNGDTLVSAKADPAETEKRRQEIQDLMDQMNQPKLNWFQKLLKSIFG